MTSVDFKTLLADVASGDVEVIEPVPQPDYSGVAKLTVIDLVDFFDETKFPRRQPVVEGLLHEQELIILSGPAKIGKSLLSTNLALAVSNGAKFLDQFQTRQGPVLILQTEVANDAFRARLQKMLRGGTSERGMLLISTERIMLDDKRGLSKLRNSLNELRPILTIMDPFYCLHRKDEDKAAQIAPILSDLSDLVRKNGSACLLVHHQGKRGESDGRQTGHQHRGSSAFGDVPDGSWSLTRQGNGAAQLSFELRNAAPPSPVVLELDRDNLWWRVTGGASGSADPFVDLIKIVKDRPGISRTEFLKLGQSSLGVSERSVEDYLSRALKAQTLVKRAEKGLVYLYCDASELPQAPRDLRNLGGAESGPGAD